MVVRGNFYKYTEKSRLSVEEDFGFYPHGAFMWGKDRKMWPRKIPATTLQSTRERHVHSSNMKCRKEKLVQHKHATHNDQRTRWMWLWKHINSMLHFNWLYCGNIKVKLASENLKNPVTKSRVSKRPVSGGYVIPKVALPPCGHIRTLRSLLFDFRGGSWIGGYLGIKILEIKTSLFWPSLNILFIGSK